MGTDVKQVVLKKQQKPWRDVGDTMAIVSDLLVVEMTGLVLYDRCWGFSRSTSDSETNDSSALPVYLDL